MAGGVAYASSRTAVEAFAAGGCGIVVLHAATVAQAAAGTLSVADGRVFVASPFRLAALASS